MLVRKDMMYTSELRIDDNADVLLYEIKRVRIPSMFIITLMLSPSKFNAFIAWHNHMPIMGCNCKIGGVFWSKYE